MNNLLVRQIAEDLKILKFTHETDWEYGNRLVYSSLSAWARMLVLGGSYADIFDGTCSNESYHNVDIMHISVHLAQVAYGILTSVPHSPEWAVLGRGGEKYGQLSGYIIGMLVFCYELSRRNCSRRIIVSPERTALFNQNKLNLGGVEWKSREEEVCWAGVGRWSKCSKSLSSYREIFNIPPYSIRGYYNNLINDAVWEKNELNDTYQVFKTGSRRWYKYAWVDFNKSKLPEGVSLLKNVEAGGGYFLAKNENGSVYCARLDQWYSREREVYRIMYALDAVNDTPPVFDAKYSGGCIELHCNSLLPNAEMRILHMASWPKCTYRDTYYRIIPEFLWPELKAILDNLDIIIEFKN